jgi:hypothetical protein
MRAFEPTAEIGERERDRAAAPDAPAAPAAAAAAMPPEPVWRRFAVTFMAAFFGGLSLIYAALVLIDPYDTGRFATFMRPGVVDGNQRTASASRGRDPRFNAAVIGNSRGQLLDPQLLSQATGLDFVQLTTPGSGPNENITVMRYFMRHHSRIAALVLSADERWCGHDPSLPVIFPFPFWLYRGDLEYLEHLLSTRAVTAARNRIALAMGLRPPTDPRGYSDYETGRVWTFHPGIAGAATEFESANADALSPNTYFPALAELDAVLAAMPSDTGFVIVMPPVYRAVLAHPGTQLAADLLACKAELARRLADRERSGFLDFLFDGPISRDPENFMDPQHYRMNIARMIEARIAAVLARGPAAHAIVR